MPTYYVKGSGASITLTDKQFIAKGGEKEVYAIGPTAYCVYHDPSQAMSPDKIAELSVLTDPSIIKPTCELLDSKKRHCGEVMPFVSDSFAPSDPSIRPLVLCQLFTNAFRRKNGVTLDHIRKITDSILSLSAHCHSKGVVMVDPNETNWLVKPSLDGTCLIDTSCFQTATFPGTAIKPAIRDWNAKKFTRESDWFSMAVVIGWLWAGIHPYLSHHPDWEHIDSNAAMEPRMRSHVSFFDPKTEFNRACRPLSEIPSALQNWLRSTLQDGKRLAPPKTCGDPVSVRLPQTVKNPTAVSGISVSKISVSASDIIGVFGDILVLEDSWMKDAVVGFTPLKNIAVAAKITNERSLSLSRCDTKASIQVIVRANRVFETEGRLYTVSGSIVSELIFNELASELRVTAKQVGNVADLQTTRVYQGCVVQNLLGKYLLSIFPESGKCQQYHLEELGGRQILGAKYERGVLCVMSEQSGCYELWMYRFSGAKQDATLVSTDFGDVNFCVTDRGACVLSTPDGSIKILMNSPGSAYSKTIKNPIPDSTLFSDGSKVFAAEEKILYRLSLS